MYVLNRLKVKLVESGDTAPVWWLAIILFLSFLLILAIRSCAVLAIAFFTACVCVHCGNASPLARLFGYRSHLKSKRFGTINIVWLTVNFPDQIAMLDGFGRNICIGFSSPWSERAWRRGWASPRFVTWFFPSPIWATCTTPGLFFRFFIHRFGLARQVADSGGIVYAFLRNCRLHGNSRIVDCMLECFCKQEWQSINWWFVINAV